MNYILNAAGEPVPEADILAWARWFKQADRVVERTSVARWRVSTVFLSIDHAFGLGPPLLWETMVFPEENFRDVYCARYTSVVEARADHARVVAHLSAGKPPDTLHDAGDEV